jgi:geranylgeranyl diphosphate synthase type 3/geranylgeranyl diphosphate synthase type I
VLARLSARLTSLISGANADFIQHIGRFAEAIGVAFQIQDGMVGMRLSCVVVAQFVDILNLTGEEFVKKNSCVGEDIHEGKRSLMVIHSLSTSPEDKKKRLIVCFYFCLTRVILFIV